MIYNPYTEKLRNSLKVDPEWIEKLETTTLFPHNVSLYEEMYANFFGSLNDKYKTSGLFPSITSALPKDSSVRLFFYLIRYNDLGIRIPIFEEVVDEAFDYVLGRIYTSFDGTKQGNSEWDEITYGRYLKAWYKIRAQKLFEMEYRLKHTKKVLTELGLLVPAITKEK